MFNHCLVLPLFLVAPLFLFVRKVTSSSSSSSPCVVVRTSSFAETNPFEALAATHAFDGRRGSGIPGGDCYSFRHTVAPSGMRAIDKMDNDELDIVTLGSTPAANGIARGVGFTVLSVMHGLSGSESLAVRDIDSPQELRGKTIGVPCGSTAHYALLAFLKQTGVQEVNVVCDNPNNLKKRFLNATTADIDGAWLWRPPVTEMYQNGASRLADAGLTAQWKKDVFNVWAVRNKFLKKHPKAVAHFMNYVTVVSEDIVVKPQDWKSDSPFINLMVGMCLRPPPGFSGVANSSMRPGIISQENNFGDDMVFLSNELTNYLYETMISCDYMGPSSGVSSNKCDCSGSGVPCAAVQLSETASFVLQEKALAATLPTPKDIYQNFFNSSFVSLLDGENHRTTMKDIFDENHTKFVAISRPPDKRAACDSTQIVVLGGVDGVLWSNNNSIALGYPANWNCKWRVVGSTSSEMIVLNFTRLSLERQVDTVRIVEEDTGLLVAQFTGRQYDLQYKDDKSSLIHFPLISGRSPLVVTFVSDSYNDRPLGYDMDDGFAASYQSAPLSVVGLSTGTSTCSPGLFGVDCRQRSCFGTTLVNPTLGGGHVIIQSNADDDIGYSSTSECWWRLEGVKSAGGSEGEGGGLDTIEIKFE